MSVCLHKRNVGECEWVFEAGANDAPAPTFNLTVFHFTNSCYASEHRFDPQILLYNLSAVFPKIPSTVMFVMSHSDDYVLD